MGYRNCVHAFALAGLVLFTVAAQGQATPGQAPSGQNSSAQAAAEEPDTGNEPLGDVARKQRQLSDKAANTAHKVVTDEDMPEHSGNEAGTAVPDDSTASDDDGPGMTAMDKEQRGEQLKQAISAEKQAIAEAQSQIDKANESIHFVEANRYSNGVQYNEEQTRRQEEIERIQSRLDERKMKLSKLQEKARREGFSSAVYDP